MNKISLPYNLYLIGFMGCGKSSTAGYLSREHGMTVKEMDEMLVEREGMPIPEIFAQKGEPYFRQKETALLREFQRENNVVVSCGGGVAMRPENVELMRENGKVVLLTARPETILERVSGNEDRPLLKGKKNVKDISDLMETRRPAYEAAADLTIHTDGKCTEEICEEILGLL